MRYPRTELAELTARTIMGLEPFSDASSGLFLAAPRRTGKSTFLQQDLKPVLESKGVVVIYVDLWSDQSVDPAVLIANQIGHVLASKQNLAIRAADAIGLTKINIRGFEVDIDAIGVQAGATLADALSELNRVSDSPVALIIDEAQHVLTSDRGDQVMAALKSARDQMNRPDSIKLMLVMSGSDRDKLLRLTNTRSAAFFGSVVRPMPLLEDAYVLHLAGTLVTTYPNLGTLSNEKLINAFEIFGRRPQVMLRAIESALSPFSDSPQLSFEDRILQNAAIFARENAQDHRSTYLSLPLIQRAVLAELLSRRTNFRPFDAESNQRYASQMGRPVEAWQVQNALLALRESEPPLIWKSSRGEYALEDSTMQTWYDLLVDQNAWPPAG